MANAPQEPQPQEKIPPAIDRLMEDCAQILRAEKGDMLEIREVYPAAPLMSSILYRNEQPAGAIIFVLQPELTPRLLDALHAEMNKVYLEQGQAEAARHNPEQPGKQN